MKESEKQEQALNHLALLPGNPLIPDMILNMTSSEERLGHGGTIHARRYPHKHLFSKQHAEMPRSSAACAEATAHSRYPSTYLAR